MLAIIACHAAAHGVTQRVDITYENYSWKMGLTYIFYMAGDIGNNIFILISGYYMSQKYINKRRIFDIVVNLFFYSWLLLVVGFILFRESLSLQRIVVSICPFITGQNWFVTCYLFFCLIVPFLNTLLSNLDDRKFKILTVILVLLYGVIPFFQIKTFVATGNYMDKFVVMYVTGAYFRRKQEITHKRAFEKSIALILLMVLVTYAIGYGGKFSQNNSLIELSLYLEYFWGTIISISIFVATLSFKMFSCNPINYIASSVLPIYLISENGVLWPHLWTEIIPCESFLESKLFGVLFVIAILVVFICCLAIDITKKELFKLLNSFFDRIYLYFDMVTGKLHIYE